MIPRPNRSFVVWLIAGTLLSAGAVRSARGQIQQPAAKASKSTAPFPGLPPVAKESVGADPAADLAKVINALVDERQRLDASIQANRKELEAATAAAENGTAPTAVLEKAKLKIAAAEAKRAEIDARIADLKMRARAADAKKPSATLDELLTQAMEKNPDIVAADAKLKLTQAESSRTRLDVARQLTQLWNERGAQEKTVELARSRFHFGQEGIRVGRPGTSVSDVAGLQLAVIDAEAKLSRVQAEIQYLIGQGAGGSEENDPDAESIELPRGPIADKLRKSLDETVSLVTEGAVPDVLKSLQKTIQIPIQIDPSFEESEERVLHIDLQKMSLQGILQAIEDQCEDGSAFVVRTYGLLLTTRDRAEAEGMATVSDFLQAPAGSAKVRVRARQNGAGGGFF